MFHSSRTTLRELKKRYLNILKKCLLANLGIILLSTSSIAETEIIFDEVYDSITKEGPHFQGAFFRNKAEFGSVKFTNNSVTAENNLQGAFAIAWGINSTFKGEVLVENNNFTLGTYGGSFISSDGGGEFIFEKKVEFINNHTITTNNGFATGSILDGSAHFKETALFQNNTVNKGNAGVIYNQKVGLINEDGTIEKYGITFDKTAIFLGNASISGSGGAIYNGNVYSGTILFQDDAYFGVQYNEDGTKTILGNEAVNGGAIYSVNGYLNQNGAIYNQYSTIDFKKKTEFVSNKATTAGGAIYNKSGSVVFEDHDENSETPAVPNITYGMTFKGDTTFTGNKAESVNASANGGAIYNSGYMLLAGENTFDSNQAKQGGAIYNTGGKKEGDVIAYGMTLGKSTFMNNTALSNGGAIFNSGSGIISLLSADFINNIANAYQESCGGGLYNNGQVTFNGIVKFEKNQSITQRNYASGGAIRNSSVNAKIDFNEHVLFGGYDLEGNSLGNVAIVIGEEDEDGKILGFHARGGAIYNEQQINFKSVEFINNKALGLLTTSLGGAIHNTGNAANINFSELAIFQDNIAEGYTNIQGGAIYNNSGLVVFEDHDENSETSAVPNITYGMTFKGDTTFTGNKAESETGSSVGGAIYNSHNRYMLLAGENTFDSNQAKQGGAIYNTGGKKEGDVIAYGMTLGKSTFMGNTALSNGGAIYNNGYMNFSSEIGDIIFKDNKVNSLNSFGYSGAIQNDANSQITFNSDVIFDGNSVSAYIQVGGGAIVNNGTLNFKGGKFISNKAESSTFIVSGGAISNGGEITFSDHVIFGGYDENGNSLGNIAYAKKYINENGQEAGAWAAGGAINNGQSGKIIFDSASFIGNKSIADISGSSSGAIQNIGQIVFKGSSFFISNIAGGKLEDGQVGSGGAIDMYNSNASITFSSEGKKDDWTVFLNNKAIGNGALYGGGIDISAGTLNFNSNFIFANNSGYYGKDLSYGASAKVNLNNGNETVGIFASGIFSSVGAQLNKTGSGVLIIGDMSENTSNRGLYTQTDGITIAKTDKFFGNKEAVNVINGGVLSVHGGIPTFTATLGNVTDEDGTKISSGTLEFQNNIDTVTNVSAITDKINVAEGATGTKIILGAYRDVEKKEHEDLINNKTVKMTNDDGTITEQSLKTLTYKDENGETKTYDVVANLFNTTTLGTANAKYHLDADVGTEGNIIAFENSEVTFGLTEYKNGSYEMGENVTLNMQDDEATDKVTFASISGESANLLIDMELKAKDGEGLELLSDKLSVQTPTDETYTVKVDLSKINVIGELGDNGLNETYSTKVVEGDGVLSASNSLKVFTDVYQYDVAVDEDKQSIKLSGIGASGENALKEAMDYEGDSAFKFSVVGKEYAFNLDTPITLGSGDKIIVGQGIEESKIASGDKKMFVIDNENTSFKISDVKITGTGEVIENKVGSVTLEKVAIEGGKVTNKDELIVEDSSINIVENQGELIASGSTITELINQNEAEVTGGKVEKLSNSGELTLETAEVTELINEKTATVTGGEVAKATNKGELSVTGATITELTNEGEATVSNGELGTVINAKGVKLELMAGTRAETVTNKGELTANGSVIMEASRNEGQMTLEGVTVSDLLNEGTIKDKGSSITKVMNEEAGVVDLNGTTVEELTNEGTLTAQDLTIKGDLKGTGLATMRGNLIAEETFRSENKIISDGMEISSNVQKMELSDLEIKEGTTLDIGTREVTAKDVTVGKEATLQVTLNGLDEFGTMAADKIEAGEGAGVHLVLGEKFEGGVFDVFKGTEGAGDLEVKHNNLYNVIEVEEGKYSFMSKKTEELKASLGATKEEVTVAEAMTQGTASHETFAKMQSEVLVALQSLDTQTVEKAKKALKAIGTSEQPSSQSIAAGHFNELTRVISQMAMEKEAEFGHSGGEEAPRAKVYVKGLYDKTKSTMGDGFKARSTGAVLGVQSEVTDDLTIGVGYAFSNTVAKEELRRTEADTNTGFLSAHYQPNAWWVSGMATYSRGQYEEEKHVLSSMGKANYDVDSWGAQVMIGYDIKMDHMVITPEMGLRYLSVKQEGYTDTLGTSVSATTSDYLTAIMGIKGAWELGKLRPMAGVSLGYDIISDDVSAVNTLANGASYTVNGDSLDRFSTNVTLDLEAELSNRTSLKLEYSGTFRKEYSDHSGMLKLEVKF